jgi:hypothetical protein
VSNLAKHDDNSTSKLPHVSDTTKFRSDWLSLQESVDEQCASMFKEALANLARAQQPATLSLRYIPSKWDGYGFNFVTPAALARFVGAADASYFCLDDPVRTLVPLLSMASETGLPTVGVELDRGFHNRHWESARSSLCCKSHHPLLQTSVSLS